MARRQGNEPIRLDFFGDEVERLTSFDIANQRSLHDLDEAVVAPAREWLLSEDARQRAERMIDAMPWGRSTFDRLATGQLFDGMEGWMPLFVDEPRTLLDEARRRDGGRGRTGPRAESAGATCSTKSAN